MPKPLSPAQRGAKTRKLNRAIKSGHVIRMVVRHGVACAPAGRPWYLNTDVPSL